MTLVLRTKRLRLTVELELHAKRGVIPHPSSLILYWHVL